ncbi:modular serine protease-like [Planococcus citri]|uniref:modular serine protease-like n=1 Tax=Planococcus citri TaxID=170843 RepID=UPI0031F73425
MESVIRKINFFSRVNIYICICISVFLFNCVVCFSGETPTTSADPLPEGHCAIPISYIDNKTATYKCPRSAQNQSCITNGGTAVPEYTKATFSSCKPGYSRVDNKTVNWVCLEGSWSPDLPQCEKICDKLNPVNVDLACYRNNGPIDCNGPLITGDRVHPTCKQFYTYKDFVPIYEELVCQEDGKWDNILFSCVPECGRPFTGVVTLISDDTTEKYGDSPWHVAIYDITKNLLICGGTIINPHLIVSAAHCFYDRLNQKKLPEENYEIVVGKFTGNYKVKDNPDQKSYKIKEIRFSNKGYFPTLTYHADDIAILILDEKIEISPTVLPACVDWIHTQKYHPPEGTPGKVVGWGVNELGKLSEQLLTANLPFISNNRCISIVPNDFKPYITYDKFCAGSETGPGVLQGDDGGGLLFREGTFYYIRGVVSIMQPSSMAIAAFTDLADHINWILSVRNEVEQDIIKKETTLVSKG